VQLESGSDPIEPHPLRRYAVVDMDLLLWSCRRLFATNVLVIV
jgi:hypothetical protein